MSRRLHEFSAQEAADYLERLRELLARPGSPDAQELLRQARGVRGSAQMAGADTVASVAQRLEDAAAAVANHSLRWSDDLRRLSLQTVADLALLIRALNRWGPEEEARVEAAIHRWDDLALAKAKPSEGEEQMVVPISALFYDDEGPHVLSPATETPTPDVVPIEDLLFSGEAALQAALALRPRLEAVLNDGKGNEAVQPLLEELFDLLTLGLPSPSTGE